jgi:hypothetical protein
VTPGERPLEKDDIAVIQALIPGLRKIHFNFLGRLIRFVVPDDRYEPASWPQRALADLIRAFDRAMLSTPLLEHLGGVAVFYGRTRFPECRKRQGECSSSTSGWHPGGAGQWAFMPIAFAVTLVSSAALFAAVERRFSLAPRRPSPAPLAVPAMANGRL